MWMMRSAVLDRKERMPELLNGEVLEDGAEVPPVHDVTPGWIGRNRQAIERGRRVARAMILVAPPPARLVLGAVSIAADAMLLADEIGRRMEDRPKGALRAAGVVLEGAAVLAASRLAPARLAANLAGIEAARLVLGRVAAR
jgi:hypothetical protein